jgi:hypothetical protein
MGASGDVPQFCPVTRGAEVYCSPCAAQAIVGELLED